MKTVRPTRAARGERHACARAATPLTSTTLFLWPMYPPDDLPRRFMEEERGTRDKPPPESEARARAHCAGPRGRAACSGAGFPFPPRAQEGSDDDAFPEFGDAPLSEWLTRPAVERAVKLRFARFLHRYTTPDAVHVYRHMLLDLCLSACPPAPGARAGAALTAAGRSRRGRAPRL